MDSYEAALGLDARKLAASRHVLAEYGNMLGATIIFVLDEIRRRRQEPKMVGRKGRTAGGGSCRDLGRDLQLRL